MHMHSTGVPPLKTEYASASFRTIQLLRLRVLSDVALLYQTSTAYSQQQIATTGMPQRALAAKNSLIKRLGPTHIVCPSAN